MEVLRDTAHALPPLDLKLAHDLMRQTRIWRLLQGYRDRPAADLAAIAEVLVRFSYLAMRHPEIREIDINPLLADDKGAIALDARVRVEDAARHPRVAPAIRPYPSEWAREVELPMAAPASQFASATVRLRAARASSKVFLTGARAWTNSNCSPSGPLQ